jgi:hypothetical protein
MSSEHTISDEVTVLAVTQLPTIQGVCFDPEGLALHGVYGDEISLHRAKVRWSESLKANFLLEETKDFEFERQVDITQPRFILQCRFLTACGRYAFWRLTNEQAPEAQYEIETAHIPVSIAKREEFLHAPDLRSVHDDPRLTGLEDALALNRSFKEWLQEAIRKITKKI